MMHRARAVTPEHLPLNFVRKVATTLIHTLVLGASATVLTACQHNGPTVFDDPSAIAVLAATPGSSVHGVVTFVRAGDVTEVNANLSGFKPNSTHGIHVHELGDCSAHDASSAGEHFNPEASTHGAPGAPEHHTGDLGNVTADARGDVYATFKIKRGSFGTANDSIIGRGLIVHADRDDLHSQPAGNSGARLACGSIMRNPDRMTVAKSGQT
jgi:Cu-Zn family superoxide dismutase